MTHFEGMTIMEVETSERHSFIATTPTSALAANGEWFRFFLTTVEDKPFAAFEYGEKCGDKGYDGIGMPIEPFNVGIEIGSCAIEGLASFDSDFGTPILMDEVEKEDDGSGLKIVEQQLCVLHPLGVASLTISRAT
ncbi:MAG: hypothetical protein ACXWLH_02040 [Candidatus Saccharimonadales bacterium]